MKIQLRPHKPHKDERHPKWKHSIQLFNFNNPLIGNIVVFKMFNYDFTDARRIEVQVETLRKKRCLLENFDFMVKNISSHKMNRLIYRYIISNKRFDTL